MNYQDSSMYDNRKPTHSLSAVIRNHHSYDGSMNAEDLMRANFVHSQSHSTMEIRRNNTDNASPRLQQHYSDSRYVLSYIFFFFPPFFVLFSF